MCNVQNGFVINHKRKKNISTISQEVQFFFSSGFKPTPVWYLFKEGGKMQKVFIHKLYI